MIYAPQNSAVHGQESPVKPAFQMKSDQNGRINGSVPVFGNSASWAEEFSRSLENRVQSAEGGPKSPENALNLKATDTSPADNPDSSFGFFDLLDIINPLQHIPIVGTIYRHITGDEIGSVAQVIGGGVFGGPIGAAAGLASAIVTRETGEDIGDAVLGLFSHDQDGLEGTTIALADLTRTRSPYNS